MEITLRPWRDSDLEQLLEYAGNPAIAANMTDAFPHPYTVQNGRDFIQFANRDNPVHIFAIDIVGIACGGIGIHPQSDIYRRNAELGYWLAEPYWGKGITVKAIAMILKFAFGNYDIERVFARPFGSNKASQRVLEKSGFLLEARIVNSIFKNGKFQDELIYGFRRSDLKD